MPDGNAFLGTGWSFPVSFSPRGRAVAMVSEEEDIREALRILFSTEPGERVMRPSYGGGLRAMVFEHIGQATVTEIRDRIERAVLFFEPRIDLEGVEIVVEDALAGIIEVTLSYRIRSTNTRSNLVYPFYLLQGTDIVGSE
ncbi:GPW/gp25 family protein [Granulosicoccus sp. 3-233]|uniref:GPW/gp25 family protein n=1 Tax=Granulosicoccus sp. 3-233 TaxID=3417969 RepID=UPI003D33D466